VDSHVPRGSARRLRGKLERLWRDFSLCASFGVLRGARRFAPLDAALGEMRIDWDDSPQSTSSSRQWVKAREELK